MKSITFFALFLALGFESSAQAFTRYTFHDLAQKIPKEVFQVKDTIRNTLHGRYISYYMNGHVESKGQFTNNETTGIWEFFYETGKLKMRGILRQNANFGVWEYFYEGGQKSMEGNVNGKNREGEWTSYYENGQIKEEGEYKINKRSGLWKTYFEDGVLKGEIDYQNDSGKYTEYYHSGSVYAEGHITGTRNVGMWRYFRKEGEIQSEGSYVNGKKQGEWISYHPDEKIASREKYDNGEPTGFWQYFYRDGKTSHSGAYENAMKSGEWKSFFDDGSPNSETTYNSGIEDYREYYPSGRLKVQGKTVSEKREGKWIYFYADGRKEGECDYQNGKGTYYGYFPNGNLQTKGLMDGILKAGTWEIYEVNGQLSGYYRPFYDNQKLEKEIGLLSGSPNTIKKVSRKGKKLTYFDPRYNEFQGFVVKGNPLMVFAGRLPLGVEFYLQERLGHEFEFIGIRDPFFKSDLSVPSGNNFQRGYAICIKQKLYNPVKIGMWYFGHEIRFTNFGHFMNQPLSPTSTELFTFSTVEQRIEWGFLLGHRIAKSTCGKGFTIDAFISGDVGYRGFDIDPIFKTYLQDINQSKLSTTFHFGLNFGNVFSFR